MPPDAAPLQAQGGRKLSPMISQRIKEFERLFKDMLKLRLSTDRRDRTITLGDDATVEVLPRTLRKVEAPAFQSSLSMVHERVSISEGDVGFASNGAVDVSSDAVGADVAVHTTPSAGESTTSGKPTDGEYGADEPALDAPMDLASMVNTDSAAPAPADDAPHISVVGAAATPQGEGHWTGDDGEDNSPSHDAGHQEQIDVDPAAQGRDGAPVLDEAHASDPDLLAASDDDEIGDLGGSAVDAGAAVIESSLEITSDERSVTIGPRTLPGGGDLQYASLLEGAPNDAMRRRQLSQAVAHGGGGGSGGLSGSSLAPVSEIAASEPGTSGGAASVDVGAAREVTITRRRAQSTGLGEEMWKEGWLLKEAGEAASGRQRWVDRMKHVLPRRRYCVLFSNRLAYYAELVVKMPNTADPGVELNTFNTVVGFAKGATASGVLKPDDVITEVDGNSIVGEKIDWKATAPTGKKRTLKIVRLRGVLPLNAAVQVKRCSCVLSRVNSQAAAFEVDLSASTGLMGSSTKSKGPKCSYIFICSDSDEADEWVQTIQHVCTSPGAASTRL